jgi:hypothetical protein
MKFLATPREVNGLTAKVQASEEYGHDQLHQDAVEQQPPIKSEFLSPSATDAVQSSNEDSGEHQHPCEKRELLLSYEFVAVRDDLASSECGLFR